MRLPLEGWPSTGGLQGQVAVDTVMHTLTQLGFQVVSSYDAMPHVLRSREEQALELNSTTDTRWAVGAGPETAREYAALPGSQMNLVARHLIRFYPILICVKPGQRRRATPR